MDDLVLIGTLGAAHGLHGALKLRAIGQADALERVGRVFVKDRGWLGVKRLEVYDGVPMLFLAGIAARADATALTGLEVYADKSELTLQDGTYYYHDLIGRAVVAPDGTALGTLKAIMDSGVQDILVVDHGRREVLVPLQAPYVRVLEDKIEIEPVPGLFNDE